MHNEPKPMMMMIAASACGKIILFGEHAVVYDRPAIAVQVTQVQATVTIEPAERGVTIHALDTNQVVSLDRTGSTDPLASIVRVTLNHLGIMQADLSIAI